ncbi:MAG: PDZ domain-containing protein [Verrucomicrobia bacterium]|nr:PDZ domain-containing protein [Verrucomicrobiota bacterium]
MKKPVYLLLAWLLPGWLTAQQDIPLLRPEERQVVDSQADEFNAALTPMLATAAKSTVRVWAGNKRLAYGTAVTNGRKVLTKFSEVARAAGALRVEAGDGTVRKAQVTGIYQDEDLAVLTLQGEPLPPVKWFAEAPKLGSFLTAPQPGGQPAAFGVVSVLDRNLRETDKSYLGVQGDFRFGGPGVKVQEVKPDSGAALAGLQVGDVILRVNDRPISGVLELRNALTGVLPGTRVPMRVRRGGEQLTLEAVLGNRPDLPQFSGPRLRQMEQMGGPISRVRESFSRVIQTDMRPAPDQIGGPVVDLQGRVVGITMARADRTRSFVMPSAAVVKLLEEAPMDPAAAKVAALPDPGMRGGTPRVPGEPGPPGIVPGDPDRLRRHVEDMQRLMDRMREEMQRLEEPDR